MTHKTDLPQPIEDTTLSPQVFIPEAERLVAVYLRTLTSPQTIKTYNTELTLFIALQGASDRGVCGGDGGQEACCAKAVFDLHVHGGRHDGEPRVSAFLRQEPACAPGSGL